MTREQQQNDLEKLHGWRRSLMPEDHEAYRPPDYLSDLNAVHELEKKLLPTEWLDYLEWLGYCEDDWGEKLFPFVTATAAQRCEAILKVKGLWR